MTLPRHLGFEGEGEGDEREAVLAEDHPYFTRPGQAHRNDEPQPLAAIGSDGADILRRLCDVLEDGPPRQMPARLEALKMHFHLSGSTLREAAVLARTSRNSVHRAVRKVGQLFGGKSAESGTPTDR